jgi:hypothetical protein
VVYAALGEAARNWPSQRAIVETLLSMDSGLLKNGAQGRNRTTDTVIFSHVLYQLSYLGAARRRRAAGAYRRWRCALSSLLV